jgi:hypothetical protein
VLTALVLPLTTMPGAGIRMAPPLLGGRSGSTPHSVGDALKVIQSETVLRWCRHGIALIWKYLLGGRWQGGRPRIALESRQLIREMARANFLSGAPRIHGELLKLGIIVSQATVSRFMPLSRKPRRSQALRTFIWNHAVTIVQSRGWARDLLSQVQTPSSAFMYHLSTSVVAPAAGLSG